MKRTFRVLLLLLATAVISINSYGKLPVITQAFDSIPFEICPQGKMYVSAYVNTDTVPLRFLFDTGAIDNVLNTNSKLAIRTINPDNLIKGNSNTSTSQTTVSVTPYENSITIGETEFQGV